MMQWPCSLVILELLSWIVIAPFIIIGFHMVTTSFFSNKQCVCARVKVALSKYYSWTWQEKYIDLDMTHSWCTQRRKKKSRGFFSKSFVGELTKVANKWTKRLLSTWAQRNIGCACEQVEKLRAHTFQCFLFEVRVSWRKFNADLAKNWDRWLFYRIIIILIWLFTCSQRKWGIEGIFFNNFIPLVLYYCKIRLLSEGCHCFVEYVRYVCIKPAVMCALFWL